MERPIPARRGGATRIALLTNRTIDPSSFTFRVGHHCPMAPLARHALAGRIGLGRSPSAVTENGPWLMRREGRRRISRNDAAGTTTS